MLKCLPLWAILVTQCGQSWAFYTLLTELPTYMSKILHIEIQAVRNDIDPIELIFTKKNCLERYFIGITLLNQLDSWHNHQHIR